MRGAQGGRPPGAPRFMRGGAGGGRPPAAVEHVDRAVALADVREAVGHRVAGDGGGAPWRRPAATARRRAPRRAPRSGCSRRRASPRRRDAAPESSGESRPSKRWSAGVAPCPPVTRAAPAPIATSRCASWARSSVSRPVSACASGRFGVTTVASGNSRPVSVATASGSSSRLPELANKHRVDHQRQPAPGQLVGHRLDDRGGEQHAGLDGVGADVVEHRPDLIPNEIG